MGAGGVYRLLHTKRDRGVWLKRLSQPLPKADEKDLLTAGVINAYTQELIKRQDGATRHSPEGCRLSVTEAALRAERNTATIPSPETCPQRATPQLPWRYFMPYIAPRLASVHPSLHHQIIFPFPRTLPPRSKLQERHTNEQQKL